jgi:hypothetical protein
MTELKQELIQRVFEGELKPFESFFLFKYGNVKTKQVLAALWESERWYSFALENLDKSRAREIIEMHLNCLEQQNVEQLKLLFQQHHDMLGPKIGTIFSFNISHALIEKLLNSNIKFTVEQFSLLLSTVADNLNNDVLDLLIRCKPKKVERNIHIYSQMLVIQTEKTPKSEQAEMDKLMRIYNRLSKLNISKHAGFLLLDLLKIGNVNQEFIFYCLDACDDWQRSCAMAFTDSKEELLALLEKWENYRYKGKN